MKNAIRYLKKTKTFLNNRDIHQNVISVFQKNNNSVSFCLLNEILIQIDDDEFTLERLAAPTR
jgi:hypothetical protein